jgi:hypothetical protein
MTKSAKLIQCLNSLPAITPIPINALQAALVAKGQKIMSASGSMALENTRASEACPDIGPAESAAALASILIEELEHWHTVFPQFEAAQMVWLFMATVK